MVFCGELTINKNPKSTWAGFSSMRTTESGRKQYFIPIRHGFDSVGSFKDWLNNVILSKATGYKLNGVITYDDVADHNNSGDLIVEDNILMTQPVLPIF